ncbi:hypothetical protein LSH36_17g12005 [Paralvinella palmiformis]|uniref:Uncharacterized protein n=1 Tax=Paralvinella palmiformis TaxID=53620 RepID=A0AAD9KC37_9ANNE|nr:hypothetical protein LSH36_17g12005 [Paralvinella palmiformis]
MTTNDDDDDDDDDGNDDMDIDEYLSDEEVDFGDDGDDLMSQFKNADGESDESGEREFDEEAVAFSDDNEYELDKSPSTDRRRLNKSGKRLHDDGDAFLDGAPPGEKKRKSAKFDTVNLYAAAEEFADVIDDNTSSKILTIGSDALSNKDNAGKSNYTSLYWMDYSRDKRLSSANVSHAIKCINNRLPNEPLSGGNSLQFQF